jgi:hypothetical protein
VFVQRLHHAHSGIVHQDVDVAESRHRGARHPLGRLFLAHVARNVIESLRVARGMLAERVGTLLPNVDRDHTRCARIQELDRGRQPDARCGAGDDGDLAFQGIVMPIAPLGGYGQAPVSSGDKRCRTVAASIWIRASKANAACHP